VFQHGARAVLVGGAASAGEHIIITEKGVCTSPIVSAWPVAAVATSAEANCTYNGARVAALHVE